MTKSLNIQAEPLYKTLSFTQPTSAPLPLIFSTAAQEIDIIALLALLNFGAHYAKDLSRLCNRSVQDCTMFGVLSMHISSFPLTASALHKITAEKVSMFFDLPTHTDEEHPSHPAIKISRPSVLQAFAKDIARVLNKIGGALLEIGQDSLGGWIMSLVQSGYDARRLLDELTLRFDAFRDGNDGIAFVSFTPSADILIYAKANRLVADLYIRFSSTDPAFDFADIDALDVSVDCTIMNLFKFLGIVEIPKDSSEWDFRGACLLACYTILQECHSNGITRDDGKSIIGIDLDAALRKLAKKQVDMPLCEWENSTFY